MRFLKLLLTYVLIGGTLLAVGIFLIMYAISFLQASSVAASLSTAKQLSRRPAHVQDCMVGDADDEYPLLGYRLRFENEADYVVEAVCVSPVRGPFEVVKKSLVLGVKKERGYSGVFFPVTTTEEVDARLVVRLGYARWLIEASTKARVGLSALFSDEKPLAGIESADATCEGWGYQCCNHLTQMGIGEVVSGKILSCHESCFTACLERPSILIFTSEPEMDSSTRVTNVSKQDGLVIFSYSIQDTDSTQATVVIDYGDGQNATSTNFSDQFSHQYACQSSTCDYTATLSVKDGDGLDNSRTRISEVTVRVR